MSLLLVFYNVTFISVLYNIIIVFGLLIVLGQL